jgi:hypothetical protein
MTRPVMLDPQAMQGFFKMFAQEQAAPAPTEPLPPSLPSWWELFQIRCKVWMTRLTNLLFSLILFTAGGGTGWIACEWNHKPLFNRTIHTLRRGGYTLQANRLAELPNVCDDRAGTPASCQALLLFGERPEEAIPPRLARVTQ